MATPRAVLRAAALTWALLTFTVPGYAQTKGGGKGGGSTPPPPSVSYSFRFLGSLGGVAGPVASRVYDMNDHGDIVGMAANAAGQQRAILSRADTGELVDLTARLSDADRVVWRFLSEARSIGNGREIVGSGNVWTSPTSSSMRAFRLTMGFFGEDGSFTWLEHPLFEDLGPIYARGINVYGDTSGEYETLEGTRAFRLSADLQAFEDLGVADATHNYSAAHAINASGHVAGMTGTNPGERHAFLYSPELGMLDLGVFKAERGGYEHSQAYDLNGLSVVVGQASAGGWSRHAFRWDGVLKNLGTFGGENSEALGINNLGDVVGHAQDSNATIHAFLSVGGNSLFKLQDLVIDMPVGVRLSVDTPAGWHRYESPLGLIRINDASEIAGTCQTSDGILHAYVLTPVPAAN